MKNKNIIKLFAFLWSALLIVSCSNEDLDRKDGPTVPEGLPVTMKLNVGTPDVPVVETKALENDNNTFGTINNLAVLVYDENGENPIITYWEPKKDDSGKSPTSVSDITFDAKTGNRKIYVLTNVGSKVAAEAYVTEADLLAKKENASISPTGEEMMLGCVAENWEASLTAYEAKGKVVDIQGSEKLYAKVIPPYTKITFKIEKNLPENMRVYLEIKEVNVRNLPVKYSFFPQKWTLENGITADNMISLYNKDKSGDDFGKFAIGKDFYMYENCQGENNKMNSDPKLKTPEGLTPPTGKGHSPSLSDFETWYEEWNKVPCTYIEIVGNYTIFKTENGVNHVGDGQINYRFFLGENSTSDFNIRRNTHYNVILTFEGEAGKDELNYEWRVFADLEHATFYPKGELIIDGAPAIIGVVPFYVVNNSSGAVTMATDKLENADMKIYYEVDYGGGPYYTNSSVASVAVKRNDYNKFGAASNNLGILNSDGHTDVQNDNNYVYYKDDGQTVTSFSDKDNITLREQVGRGKIYRTRNFYLSIGTTLEVKEYPLLYLGDATTGLGVNGNNAYYARRLDGASYKTSYSYDDFESITGKVNSLMDAKKYCKHNEYVTGALNSYLPSQADIKQIIKYEKAFPLKNDSYWTTNGLINGSTGELISNPNQGDGYIRCIYKKY